MLVVMKAHASEEQVRAVCERIESLGYRAHPIPGAQRTAISFAGSDGSFGGRDLGIVAGPCSIESREQAFAIADRVAKGGARFFRGGAYKPRTSPYAFQGMGEDGLKIMAEIRHRFGLRIITEALDEESLHLVAEYADVIQIG